MTYLAGFLRAGLSPTSAWVELAGAFPHHDVPRLVNQAVDAGESLPEAVVRITQGLSHQWRALAASWWVARHSGAPLGPALMALSSALLDTDQTRREIQAAMAGPKATMRLIAALPVIAVVGGGIGGVNTSAVLFTTGQGFAVLVVGLVMMAGALWWLRILSSRAAPTEQDWSIELDLFATATSAAMLPEKAMALVRETLEHMDLAHAPGDTLSKLVVLSRRVGVPVGGLAIARAALNRTLSRIEAEQRVQRLGVHVVLPLGLLVLPAFVLIAVAPVILGTYLESSL